MKKLRVFAMLLCLLTVFALVLTSCGGEEETSQGTTSGTTSETSGSETDIYKDAEGNYSLVNLKMPEFNFTQTEFKVAVYSNEKESTYYSEEIDPEQMYDTTELAIKDAVKVRNDLIESETGVKIVGKLVPNVRDALVDDFSTGMHSFDAAMPFMGACAALAQDGMLYNLNNFTDYFHFDAPWWDHSACESLSIGGNLYFTTGDISIMQKITSIALTFNKEMYSEQIEEKYGNLYNLVRQKEWTFDKMYEMGKIVTADTDGEAGMTYKDTWGLSTSDADAEKYYLASGERFISKNASDLPELALGKNENSINVAQKALSLLERDDEWTMNNQRLSGQVQNIWVTSLDVFGENRCLFRTTAFSAIKKLRAYEQADEFGIVPLPLMFDGQDTYYTPSSAKYAYGVVIPLNAEDPEFSAYMLELMCCYAKNTLTPAYYEITLKTRDASDKESEDMLDNYIFNNVVYDLGIIHDFGKVSSQLSTLMSNKSTDIVSTLDANRAAIEDAISACVEAYKLND